jgi:hypothetical protein
MAEPGGSCPSQHIGNDTDWYAVCVLPGLLHRRQHASCLSTASP